MDKLKRFCRKTFSRRGYGYFAMIVSIILAAIQLYCFAYLLFSNPGGSTTVLINAIFYLISFVFYCFIAMRFYKSINTFINATSAIFSLLLCNYVLPLLQYAIAGLFYLDIFTLVICIIAIVFFVMIIINNRKPSKRNLLILKISGLVFSLIILAFGIYNLIFYSYISLDGLSILDSIYMVLYITDIVLEMICLPIIFGIYPFILSKISNYY